MTDEHMGTCIYEKGRFELRENDNAIIDLKEDFPPIMITSNTIDDGSEPNCADTRSVLHLLNELADKNPNEEKHWYLKKMLDKAYKQYSEQKEENEQLKQRNDRQAKQLDNLYHLIGKEDWKTLKGIIMEFQECEERLQREWGTYGDVE